MAGRRPHSDPEQEQQKASSKHPTTRWRALLALTLAALLVVTAGCSGLGAGGQDDSPTPGLLSSETQTETVTAAATPMPTATPIGTATATPAPTPTAPTWVEDFSQRLSTYAPTDVAITWINDSLTRVTVPVNLGSDYTAVREGTRYSGTDYRAYHHAAAELVAHSYVTEGVSNGTTIELIYDWNGTPALRTQINTTTAYQYHTWNLPNYEFRERLLADASRLPGHPDMDQTGSFITFASPYFFAPYETVTQKQAKFLKDYYNDTLGPVGLAENITDVYVRDEPFYYNKSDGGQIAFRRPIVVEAVAPQDWEKIQLNQYDNMIDTYKPAPRGFIIDRTIWGTAYLFGEQPYGITENEMTILKLESPKGNQYSRMNIPNGWATDLHKGKISFAEIEIWIGMDEQLFWART